VQMLGEKGLRAQRTRDQVHRGYASREETRAGCRAKCGIDNARKWQVWWMEPIVSCHVDQSIRWGKGIAGWRRTT
jgi:hypothetical protein